MKLIIAGSRHITPSIYMIDALIEQFRISYPTEIVSGGAAGADGAGEKWATCLAESLATITKFPADWDKHGKAAGPMRNRSMAEYADALLLIWDGTSRGSANMKTEMVKLGKPVYEVVLKSTNRAEEDAWK